jgi:hypothetical protein
MHTTIFCDGDFLSNGEWVIRGLISPGPIRVNDSQTNSMGISGGSWGQAGGRWPRPHAPQSMPMTTTHHQQGSGKKNDIETKQVHGRTNPCTHPSNAGIQAYGVVELRAAASSLRRSQPRVSLTFQSYPLQAWRTGSPRLYEGGTV